MRGAAARLLPLLFALAVVAGCADPQMRPFAEAELFDHGGGGQNSYASAGISFVGENGVTFDVGPAMRFDFGGGGDILGDHVWGAMFRLRCNK